MFRLDHNTDIPKVVHNDRPDRARDAKITLRMEGGLDYEITVIVPSEALAKSLLTKEIKEVEIEVINYVDSVEKARKEKRTHKFNE